MQTECMPGYPLLTEQKNQYQERLFDLLHYSVTHLHSNSFFFLYVSPILEIRTVPVAGKSKGHVIGGTTNILVVRKTVILPCCYSEDFFSVVLELKHFFIGVVSQHE